MRATRINRQKYRVALARAMPLVIETEQEYQRMMGVFEKLMDKDDDRLTPEDGRLLKLLATLLEEYENRQYPLPKSRPHEMLRHLIEEKKLKPSDLWPVIGSKSRVSEILSGKRSTSKAQAQRLADFFHAPIELFL